MRFLVDAQLPPILARFLEERGLEARAVREVGLRDASDSAIWDFAARDGWIIVTKDEDFPERVLRSRASPQVRSAVKVMIMIARHVAGQVFRRPR